MFFMIEHLAQNQVTRLKPGRQMLYVAHYSNVSSGIQGVLFTLKLALLLCPTAVQKYFMTKPKKMFVTKTFWVNVPWEQSSTYLYIVLKPNVVLSKLKHTKTSLTKKSYCVTRFSPNVESYYFKNCMKLLLCYHSHHSSLTQRCIIVHAGAG